MSDKLTSAEARALLDIREPTPVGFTSEDGKFYEGDHADSWEEIDARETVPWVMALGPFGSWPSTLEDAEKDFAAHPEWYYGVSFRLGNVVVWKQGWGYAAKERAK